MSAVERDRDRDRERDRDRDKDNDRDRSQRKGAPPRVIIDLSKLSDQQVIVRLAGGRQVRGVLKGWDPLLNLVLDEAVEQLRDASDPYRLSGKERTLGLMVARGTSVMTVAPVDGVEQIDNPFLHTNG